MPLIDSLTFTQATDIDAGVVADASDYGVSGNPLRSDTANYLLWSKTDQDGNRTFTNPSSGDVLATLSYSVVTLIDGYYEAILLRINIYSGAVAYVPEQSSGGVITQYAAIVYYDGVVYKCIANSTDNLPTDTAFFEPVTDLSTILDNTNVDVYIEEVYIKVRSSRCANEKFDESCGCGCNGDLEKMKPGLTIRYKLIAADSAFVNNNPEQMDKIIRDIEATCANC